MSAFSAGMLVLTWWRADILPIDPTAPVTAELVAQGSTDVGAPDSPLSLIGVWHLESATRDFGGYSALIALADGSLLAGSDTGTLLMIEHPGTATMAGSYPELAVTEGRAKRDADLEALTLDRTTGTIWGAYESSNAIERYSPGLQRLARVKPTKMRRSRGNGGPEAMVRLADGRFVVLAEVRFDSTPGHRAVLFPRDPTLGDEGVSFGFAAPEGMRPVDMTQLADGTVLVLVRSVEWYFPPRFASAIAVLDPVGIEPGALWRPERVIPLPEAVPQENYEGLAVEPGAGGASRLWLISDDNVSGFQRTLLVALDWRG
ncbi:esterase-like activity of phytase family protein [Erythrobacter sp. QSSC1-22B]|uniref:esterase-like activity of phytase family protein n=1 Tax=Erythrobacter sp. QSSC1-22B TaxID=1860125 RepID=UPI0011AA3680|nr:esterase-like activity of phytase family protein [Erythrobacter sp. QSSC1-22B]